MQPDGFQLLYEQGPCLVVNKPPGVLTQAPPGIDSLEIRIKRFLKQRDKKSGNVYLGVAHRLDRPASGVLVFGRHARAARRLAEQFADRVVTKTYWAAVEGNVQPPAGSWTDYVRKIPGKAQAEVVGPHDPDAKNAVLHYRVLAELEIGNLLEIKLETGRTHQIRVQAASRGHCLLGDEQYGARSAFGPRVDDARKRAIGLHARSLQFRHPMSRDPVLVTADLPPCWPEIIHQFVADGL